MLCDKNLNVWTNYTFSSVARGRCLFFPAVNYKSSYSINLPLYWKLQTTVSCYTSTHHHLMHTISTPVRCLEWRAHVIIFCCFSNRQTLTLRWLPIRYTKVRSYFALSSSSSSSSLPHGATREYHRCTGTKRIFRIQLRYHQFFRLRLFHAVANHGRIGSFFLSLDGVLVVGARGDRGGNWCIEWVCFNDDWLGLARVGLCEQFSLRIIIHLQWIEPVSFGICRYTFSQEKWERW